MGKTVKIRDFGLETFSSKPQMNRSYIEYFLRNFQLNIKYEAIIDLSTMEPFAYEALSILTLEGKKVDVESLFHNIHKYKKMFFELEKKIKEKQIALFEKETKLFLNFDADIFSSRSQKEYWRKVLEPHREKIVIEITENSTTNEARLNHMKELGVWLKNLRFKHAIDDFLKEESMFSSKLLFNTNYIKLDKEVIKEISYNPFYDELIKGVISFAKKSKKKIILEGVETNREFIIAKKLGIDYIQGYYFKHLQFIH